jgi:hypothetical protein
MNLFGWHSSSVQNGSGGDNLFYTKEPELVFER